MLGAISAPAYPAGDPVKAFLPPEYWERPKDFFVYSAEWNVLGASASGDPRAIAIQNDSDFLVLSISIVEATTAAGTAEQTYIPVLLRIFDSASGAAWFDSPVHAQNIAGRLGVQGTGPHFLAVPRLVAAGAQVTVEATNLEATARRLWLSFHGTKIYRRLRI